MKKYAASLVMFLLVQTTYVMELVPLKSSDIKLSQKDEAKALRIAKLFNKYPKGYGETAQDKETVVSQMKSFAQSDEYKSLYQRVKKYQKTLFKLEKQILCKMMYDYEDAHKRRFAPELRQKIFINLLYLYGDVNQYYSADTALKFIITGNRRKFQDNCLVDYCKQYFLDEINRDNSIQLSFSDEGNNDEHYPSDESEVKTSFIVDIEDNIYGPKKITMTFTRKTIRELVAFLNAKQIRIEHFKALFNNCVNDLSLEGQEKGLEKFFQLSEQLKGHNNKKINIPKGVIVKGSLDEPEYNLLSLEEIFATNVESYDAEFYNQLANSNNERVSRIEFDQEKLDKFQNFPQTHRGKLADIKIKIHDKGRSFIDYIIIHVPLLINSLMPDVISYYIDDIASVIGCSTGITATLGIIGHLVMSYSMGEHIFPRVDAKFNSHMPSIKACIEEAKVRSRGKCGRSFFMSHMVHRLLSLVGNKLLSFQSFPIKIVGGLVHVIRIPLHLATLCWVDCGDTRYHEYCARDLKEKPGD